MSLDNKELFKSSTLQPKESEDKVSSGWWINDQTSPRESDDWIVTGNKNCTY